MELKEYQKKAKETAIYPKLVYPWIYPAFGLSGETGEVLEKLKRVIRSKNGVVDAESLEGLKKEIGDVLWYLAMLSEELGVSMDDIAEENIAKLRSRKERGVLHSEGDNR